MIVKNKFRSFVSPNYRAFLISVKYVILDEMDWLGPLYLLKKKETVYHFLFSYPLWTELRAEIIQISRKEKHWGDTSFLLKNNLVLEKIESFLNGNSTYKLLPQLLDSP